MKVCIVTRPDLYPAVHGAAVKIVRTAESLSRAGAETYVVTADRLRYYRFSGGEKEELAYPPRLVAATRVPPRLLPWLRRLGVPDYWRTVERVLHAVGYPPDEHLLYQPVFDPDFWLRTAFVGRRHGITVYQAEFPGFGMPCVVAAAVNGGRSCIVQHNVEHLRLAEMTGLPREVLGRLREVELSLLDWCDDVVAVSRDDRDRMVADGVDAGRITVIPHGVDLSTFEARTGAGIRERYGLPGDVPLLYFHGTLHYWPNTIACKVLVEEVLPRLEAGGVRCHALVSGMNPPDYYTHPRLTYTGVVDDLASHVAAADVCVVPLRSGGGTRMKILEYFAGARAVVSTRKGAEGIPVRDGHELMLTPDDDWDAFADRVTRLLREPALARGMGRMARRFVEGFDWDDIGRRYVALFEGRGRGGDFNQEVAAGLEDVRRPTLEEEVAEARAQMERERARRARQASRRGLPVLGATAGGQGFRHGFDAAGEPVHALGESEIVAHLPSKPAWTKPRTLILLLNKRCNLKCDFCDLWHHQDLMPYEQACKVVDRAPAAGVKTLVVTGGEPFVHPGAFDLIERARNLGLGVNVTTNGTLIEDQFDRLKRSGVDSLSISIDGMGALHDRLRGRPGTFDAVARAIERLQRETRIWLNVYFVVTNQNVQDLWAVYRYAKDRGIGFDFWPVNGYPHLYVTEPGQVETYRETVRRIAQHEPTVRERLDYYEHGIEYMGGRREHYRCLGLVEQLAVNHEGRMVPCCVWDQKDLQVGSVFDTPLDVLFYSPEAQRMREAIHRDGCLDQCFNHSLYEFQQATGLPFWIKPAERPMDVERAVVKAPGRESREARRRGVTLPAAEPVLWNDGGEPLPGDPEVLAPPVPEAAGAGPRGARKDERRGGRSRGGRRAARRAAG
ncbi:radical SAM protein [Myxococcota bacterium]|nr:radical SAM protein [Myxococcota bacterium]